MPNSYGSNLRPPEVAYYDLTPEEIEDERRYCDELRRRMLYAELHPSLTDFFRRRQTARLQRM